MVDVYPAARVSGSKIYAENQSGQALYVQISGYTNLLSGLFVDGISGQKSFVETQSGQVLYVQISGYTVPISGEKVYVETQSGQALHVQISGTTVISKVSGEKLYVETQSGQAIYVQVSGYAVRISGEKVYVETQSGQALNVQISGVVNLISGLYVQMSGQGVLISGQIVNICTPTSVFARKVTVGAISGGVALYSGTVVSVTVKAPSWNSGDIFVGGTNHLLGYSPYSGVGMQLEPTDAISMDLDNPDAIHGFAEVSGDEVLILGVAK